MLSACMQISSFRRIKCTHINMRAELQNMVEDAEKAKLGKHGKS